jgi:hypothetical protein
MGDCEVLFSTRVEVEDQSWLGLSGRGGDFLLLKSVAAPVARFRVIT